MKLLNKYAGFFLFFALVTLLLSPIRGFNHGVKFSSMVGFLLFYLLTVVLIKKYTDKIPASKILLMGLLGISLINLPFHLIYFKATLWTTLEYIIHLSAVIAGYYHVKIKKSNHKIAYVIVSVIIALVLSFYVNDLIFKMMNN